MEYHWTQEQAADFTQVSLATLAPFFGDEELSSNHLVYALTALLEPEWRGITPATDIEEARLTLITLAAAYLKDIDPKEITK